MNPRNSQKIQALALVAVLVATIATGIAFLRPHKAEFASLDIDVDRSSISITVPNCDISRFQDRFFAHVYQSTAKDGDAGAYIGRDFDLAGEPRRTSSIFSGQCVVNRPIDVPDAKKIVIGQFNMPGGRCCTILWSRTFSVKQ